jgi:hypothetical protein
MAQTITHWPGTAETPDPPRVMVYEIAVRRAFCPGISVFRRFQWSRGLTCASAAARLLGLRVPVPPRAWMFVSCECCVLLGGCPNECEREASIRGYHGPKANRSAAEKKSFPLLALFHNTHHHRHVALIKGSR